MKSRIPLGILLMILAELCFTLLWASVKFSGADLPIFQIAFFRGLISVIIIGALMLHRGVSFRIKNKKSLLARCISGYIAMLLSFFALTKISMGSAVTLLHTSPIFVAILSPIILKESVRRNLFVWIIIAFLGVIFVVKPDKDIFQNVSALALLAGFLAGIAYISIRHLHLTDNTLAITFYFTLFVSLMSLPIMLTSYVTPNLWGWLGLLGAGVFGTLAQIFLTHAYKCGPANILTPFNNAAIVFSFIFGWVVWHEVPDILAAIGAGLIICSIIFISLIVNRKKIPKQLPRIGES